MKIAHNNRRNCQLFPLESSHRQTTATINCLFSYEHDQIRTTKSTCFETSDKWERKDIFHTQKRLWSNNQNYVNEMTTTSWVYRIHKDYFITFFWLLSTYNKKNQNFLQISASFDCLIVGYFHINDHGHGVYFAISTQAHMTDDENAQKWKTREVKTT